MPEPEEQAETARQADLARYAAAQELELAYQYELARQQLQYQQAREAALAAQAATANQNPDKMGIGFFSALLVFCLALDAVDVFTGGTIGWLIGLFGDLILAMVAGMSKSGRKQFKKILVGIVGETIPIIDVLPLRSIMLVWGFVSSRSTKLQAISKTASGLTNLSKRVA